MKENFRRIFVIILAAVIAFGGVIVPSNISFAEPTEFTETNVSFAEPTELMETRETKGSPDALESADALEITDTLEIPEDPGDPGSSEDEILRADISALDEDVYVLVALGAADGTIVASSAPDAATAWELEEDPETHHCTLRFTGSGAVPARFLEDSAVQEALSAYLDRITKIEFSETITSIGERAFDGKLPALEEVSVPEGSALTSIGAYAFQNNKALRSVSFSNMANLTSLGSYAFYGCSALESAALANTQLTQISYQAFAYCKALADVTLPNTLKSIAGYAFGYTTALEQIDLPEGLNILYDYAFVSGGLKGEVVIPGTLEKFGTGSYGPFNGCHQITKITFRENEKLTSLPGWSLAFNYGLEQLDLSGLPALTSIGSVLVQTGSMYSGKLDLTLGAKALTSVSSTVFANGGYKDGEQITIHLTPEVQQVSRTLFQGAGRRLLPYFVPNHDITITGGALRDTTDQRSPFIYCEGTYHADAQGVLYKLKDDGTAMLFYCPPGITSYTVPATITDDSGREYPVNEVGSESFNLAKDLTALTFADARRVALDANAFHDSHIRTINGKTEIDTADFRTVSMLCGFPVAQTPVPDKALSVEYTTEDGSTFVLSVYNAEEERLQNGIYQYLTGESAELWFGINNEKNADMENLTVRIYLAFDGDGENLGTYQPGSYTIVNTSADPADPEQKVTHEYPLQVVKTNVPGIYYYDLTGLQPGDVMAFSNGFMYNNISSDGGNLRVWGTVLSNEEAAASAGQISNPQNYLQMQWITQPNTFSLSKSNYYSSYSLKADGTENGNIYVTGLSYSVRFTPDGDTNATTLGKDYVTSIDFVDTIQLPDMVKWDPDVVEAVREGKFSYERNGSSDRAVWIEVNGEKRKFCQATDYRTGGGYTQEVTPVVNDQGEIELHWTSTNTTSRNSAGETYATKEMSGHSVYLYLGNEMLVVDEDKLYTTNEDGTKTANPITFYNHVEETHHYSFSGDRINEADAPNITVKIPSGLSMSKVITTPNSYSTYRYLGQEMHYAIRVKNDGVTRREDVARVTDSLTGIHYIDARGLQEMFANETWGQYLQVIITPATLCIPVSGSVSDVNGDTKALNGGIAAQDNAYHGCETQDDNVLTNQATLKLTGDASGVITLQISDGRTLTIGEGQTYATVEQALDAIGFIVTSDVCYGVQWDIPESVPFYGGQEWEFPILSSLKNTLQMLKYDNPGSYYTDSGTSGNTAYAYRRGDLKQLLSASATYGGSRQFTWRKELFLYKNAAVEGQSAMSDNAVLASNGDVVDYALRFENLMGSFDVLPLVDHMEGAQILMVPVADNPDLALSGLEVYTSDGEEGISYYLLTQPGTWNNLRIGDLLVQSATVTQTSSGLDTLIKWYFPDQGIGSRNVAYKALVDVERAGIGRASDELSFQLGNEAWLGDHETHRLYASMPGYASVANFDKWIQTSADPLELVRHSTVSEGSEVLYRIRIFNRSNASMTVGGSRIYDALPETGGVFSWEGRIKSIVYEPQPGSDGEPSAWAMTTDSSYWSVTDILPGTTEQAPEGKYYIVWNNDFEMTIAPQGEMDLLVTLEFPDDHKEEGQNRSTWDAYLVKNNGADVYNTFYLDHRASTVSHELAGQAKCVLRKGVYDTFFYMNYDNVMRRHSRTTYANGKTTDWNSDLPRSTVVYYSTLYNSGSVRLYLNDLQDELPKGFSFAGLATWDRVYGYSDEGNLMKSSAISEVDSEYRYYVATASERGTVFSTVEDGDQEITYINAHITANVADNGRNITYAISAPGKQTAYDIHYDETEGRYYLEPGEALRFGYRCLVGAEADTEELATNGIAMPYYDHYGMGVTTDSPDKVRVTQEEGVDTNDGGCKVISTAQAQLYGFEGQAQTTQWLYSDVSLNRNDIVPGIAKTVGGISQLNLKDSSNGMGAHYGNTYTGAIRTDNVVNWKIRVYNENEENELTGNSLLDYTVTDTADAPYGFIGTLTYELFDKNGKALKQGNRSGPFNLVSITGRSLDTPDKMIIGGNKYFYLTKPETYTIYNSNVPCADLTVSKTQDGKEQLVLHCYGSNLVIPEGCYMEFKISTFYNSTGTVLSDQYYNRVVLSTEQEYSPTDVSNGSVIYDAQTGEATGIESGATVAVAMGYSTSAVKSITEADKPSNTARSDQEDKNFIVLNDAAKAFYYDLAVNTPDEASAPFQQLVICDALPYVGDHAAFDAREARGSQFQVSLADVPEFSLVSLADKGTGAQTEIASTYYKLYLSEKTEFAKEDWKGDYTDGWVEYPGTLTADEQVAWARKARSIKLVVTDPGDATGTNVTTSQYTLMPPKTQVRLRFYAHIDDENALPGEYAWNSFGYSCTIPTQAGNLTLNATPLKVGVRYPQFPRLAKTLQDAEGKGTTSRKDETFAFLIYTGDEIPSLKDIVARVRADADTAGNVGTAGISPAQANALIGNVLLDAGRKVTYVQVTVPAGETTAVTAQLEHLNCYRWESTGGAAGSDGAGAWVRREEAWDWEDGISYQVLELPTDPAAWEFHSIGGHLYDAAVLKQNTKTSLRILAANRRPEQETYGVELPATGGHGTLLYYLFGFLLLAIGALLAFRRSDP